MSNTRQLPYGLVKKASKFNLIYQKIMRDLNILRDFLILVIRAQILTIRF